MVDSHRHGHLLSPRAVTDRLPRSPSTSATYSPSPSPSTSPLPSRHALPTSPMGLEGIVMSKVASNDQGWEISFDEVVADDDGDEDGGQRHEHEHEHSSPGGVKER